MCVHVCVYAEYTLGLNRANDIILSKKFNALS